MNLISMINTSNHFFKSTSMTLWIYHFWENSTLYLFPALPPFSTRILDHVSASACVLCSPELILSHCVWGPDDHYSNSKHFSIANKTYSIYRYCIQGNICPDFIFVPFTHIVCGELKTGHNPVSQIISL